MATHPLLEKQNSKQKKTFVIMAGNPRKTLCTVTFVVISILYIASFSSEAVFNSPYV